MGFNTNSHYQFNTNPLYHFNRKPQSIELSQSHCSNLNTPVTIHYMPRHPSTSQTMQREGKQDLAGPEGTLGRIVKKETSFSTTKPAWCPVCPPRSTSMRRSRSCRRRKETCLRRKKTCLRRSTTPSSSLSVRRGGTTSSSMAGLD